jgi:magnesium chelatase family protein
MCFFGELSFTGDVRPVKGALNMALGAANSGFTDIFVPEKNLPEASAAAGDGVRIYGVSSVNALLSHLRGEGTIVPVTEPPETITQPPFTEAKRSPSSVRILARPIAR